MAYLSLRKNGTYILRDKTAGRWIRLGKISASEAKQIHRRYERDQTYLRLDLNQPDSDMTIRGLCDLYLEDIKPVKGAYTYTCEKYLLDHLCETFGERLVSSLSAHDVEAYLRKKKYKAYSAHNVAKSLRGAFKLGCLRKIVNVNPIESVRLPKIEKLPPRAADPKAVEKVLKQLSGIAKQYYLILAYSGMRPGECVALQVRDVTSEGIMVRSNKTKTFRVVPIHPKIKFTLALLKKGKAPGDYLFPGKGGHVQSFKKSFREAAARAKVKGVSPYSLRHTFATQVLKNTGDLRAVQTLLGHSRSTMTERYAHSLGDALKKAVRSI